MYVQGSGVLTTCPSERSVSFLVGFTDSERGQFGEGGSDDRRPSEHRQTDTRADADGGQGVQQCQGEWRMTEAWNLPL